MTGIGQSILNQGLEQGLEQGISVGENRLAELVKILLKEGKYEELSIVTKDHEERQRLYKIYGIVDEEK